MDLSLRDALEGVDVLDGYDDLFSSVQDEGDLHVLGVDALGASLLGPQGMRLPASMTSATSLLAVPVTLQ